MIKKFLLLVVVVLVAAVVVFNVAGNAILAKVLETAVGAPVKVGRFHLGLASSEVGIEGLEIKNPRGFEEPLLASVPEIFIQIDPGALFRGQLHLREFRLNLDQITVERNAEGGVNLMQLGAVKGAKQKPRPAAPRGAPGPPRGAKPPALLIDEAVLSLGRARYVDYGMGGPLVREFPLEIRGAVLRNVTDPREITQKIVFKTLQKVGLNALLPNLQELGVSWDAQSGSVTENVQAALDTLKEKFKF